MRSVISNTSCLIVLSNIGRLDLLRAVYSTVLITDEVLVEFGEAIPKWIIATSVKDKTKTMLISNSLDKGEASTIALALEQEDSLLILDDGKARHFAEGLNLALTGTLGVVVKAKKMGIIDDIAEIIAELRSAGFRLPNDIESVLLKES